MANPSHTTYSQAGVSINAGNALVEQIKPLVKATQATQVGTAQPKTSLSGLGGFASLTAMPKGYKEPVLVTSTDGVGTKLKLAIEQKQLGYIGIDLVAMCVNDVVCTGAMPLSFLDYYATAKLDVAQARQVIAGVAEGCKLAGCALSGGETAEMPGIYQHGDFDLAGFCLGIAERDKLFDPSAIKRSDVLVALSSSGPHSNGYSLIRYLLEEHRIDPDELLAGKTLAEHLLMPTHIYVKPMLAALKQFNIKGIAHITGGGITENLPRCLPESMAASIDLTSWQCPAIFNWLQKLGNITEPEMLRTFNCGVGMILVVSKSDGKALTEYFNQQQHINLDAWEIGSLDAARSKTESVIFSGKLFKAS